MAVLWPVTHHCPHQQDLTNFFKTRTGQHLDELTDLNALDHLVVVDSVPELDEAVDVSPPAVGAEEVLEYSPSTVDAEEVDEDSAPELDDAVDLPPPTVGVGEDVEDYSALSLNKAVNLLPL